MDRLEFRLKFVKDERTRAVLQKVAKEGGWGRSLPAGVAQGIAIHKEYKGVTAALVEIDCRPQTVSRFVQKEAVTGPRVRRVTFAVDAGLVVNPRGLEAQMLGGINDGIALALTSSCHLQDGHFLEASWDNYFYTRQWNTPLRVDVHVMPSTSTEPGGAGEAGVAATFAAVASAYGAATGSIPTYFPINHRDPLALQRPSRSCRPYRRRPPTASTMPAEEPRHAEADLHPQRPQGDRGGPRPASASCGCCATASVSPDRSTAAASTCARRAPRTSTARR